MIRNVPSALGAGLVGGLVNSVVVLLINSTQGAVEFDKNFLYKQAVWGALWGLAYCVPWLQRYWIARGVIAGVLASAVTFFVFFAIPFTPFNIVKAFIVNVVVWGGLSSYLYHGATCHGTTCHELK